MAIAKNVKDGGKRKAIPAKDKAKFVEKYGFSNKAVNKMTTKMRKSTKKK